MCLPPLYNVLGTVPDIFPLFLHDWTCVSIIPVPLDVAALLGHVTHFLVWQTGGDRTWIDFGAHMADIPQEVATHLDIFWCFPLTGTPLLMSLLFQSTVLGLIHSSMDRYMPVFQPCDPVWYSEAGHFLDPCISLVLLLVKADFWSACSCRLVLPKKRAPDNPPPHCPPSHSYLVTRLILCPRSVFVAPSFQTMFSETRNKLTSINLRCRTTLEVGLVFLKLIQNFWGDIIDAFFF